MIEVLQGRERKLTKEFLRLQSHSLFQEHFCRVRRAADNADHLAFLLQLSELELIEREKPEPNCCSMSLRQRTNATAWS